MTQNGRRKLHQRQYDLSISWKDPNNNSVLYLFLIFPSTFGYRSSQSIEIAGKTDGDSDESAAKADTDHFMSPPIENEEWLAFIRMTTQEVLRGEIDSLTDSNLVRHNS